MSESEVSVRFTSKEEAKLFQTFVKLSESFAKVDAGARATRKSTDDADAALRKLADREIKLSATPLENFVAKTKELDAALAKNMLTHEQHAAAVARAKEVYQKSWNVTQQKPLAPEAVAKPPEVLAREALKEFADRELKLNTTPLEKFTAKTNELSKALAANMLTREQHAAAYARAEAEWKKSWGSAGGDKIAIKAVTPAANATVKAVEIGDDIKRLAARVKEVQTAPIDKLRAAFANLDTAVKAQLLTEKQASAEKSRLWKDHLGAVDSAAKSQDKMSTAAVAAGFVVGQAWMKAIGAVRQLGQAMEQENQRALQAQQESGQSLGQLAQLTGDPQELKKLEQAAKNLRRQGAASTMEDAVQTVFAAASANAMQDLPQLSKLAIPGVIKTMPEFIRSAEGLRSALGGQETGSIPEVTAKSFEAAAKTTTTAERLVIGASRAGSQAATQGLNVNELLSAVGIIATARGSAEEGGTRMAAMLRGMEDDKSLRGKGLVGAIREIQGRKLAPEDLTKQLTAEGADAFRILEKNLPLLEETVSRTSRASVSIIEERAKLAMGMDSVETEVLKKQVKARGDLARGESQGRIVELNRAASEAAFDERRTGARGGILDYSLGLTRLLPTQVQRDINATMGSWSDSFVANMPGGMFDRRFADDTRTAPEIRAALQKAFADRDRSQNSETARQQRDLVRQQSEAAQLQIEAAKALKSAAESRQHAPRFDWSNAARKDQAVEAR